ncbi:Elongation factor 1-beta [Lobulomyces angularis]|nr:Elongation factor 1-beta [Lobulomyces angularis]
MASNLIHNESYLYQNSWFLYGSSFTMSLLAVESLNTFLADKSYIVGYTPSQADVAVFEAHKTAPKADKYPHAARWYKHVAALPNKSSLPGTKKAAKEYGPAVTAAAPAADDDENDIDLFGSDDEEDEEALKAKEELTKKRLAEYHAKKALKPKVVAKSMVVYDIKPWDDETDMKAMEQCVRAIEQDGLLWGTSKLVAIGYGIKKLQISAVVEDDKVSTDELAERITEEVSDHVQSVDINNFSKI